LELLLVEYEREERGKKEKGKGVYSLAIITRENSSDSKTALLRAQKIENR